MIFGIQGRNYHEASEALASSLFLTNTGACMHSLNQSIRNGHVVSLPPLFKFPSYGPGIMEILVHVKLTFMSLGVSELPYMATWHGLIVPLDCMLISSVHALPLHCHTHWLSILGVMP